MPDISHDPRFRLTIYQDRKHEWRWRLTRIRNGKIVAEGGEGYTRKFDCVAMVTTLFGAQEAT